MNLKWTHVDGVITVSSFIIAIAIWLQGRRSEKGLHKKLDEVVRAIDKADNDLIGEGE